MSEPFRIKSRQMLEKVIDVMRVKNVLIMTIGDITIQLEPGFSYMPPELSPAPEKAPVQADTPPLDPYDDPDLYPGGVVPTLED